MLGYLDVLFKKSLVGSQNQKVRACAPLLVHVCAHATNAVHWTNSLASFAACERIYWTLQYTHCCCVHVESSTISRNPCSVDQRCYWSACVQKHLRTLSHRLWSACDKVQNMPMQDIACHPIASYTILICQPQYIIVSLSGWLDHQPWIQ